MDIGKKLEVKNSLEWRRWLAKHHADTKEIWLVYYKKTSGKSGVTYEDSVQEALAYGWIDGQNKTCLLYTSPSPRDLSTSRMPSSA